MDDLDQAWIATVNEERLHHKQEKIQDWMLEDVLEAAEQICFLKTHLSALNGEPNKDLEFDEDAKCDICQSVDSLSYLTAYRFSIMARMEMSWYFVNPVLCVCTKPAMAFPICLLVLGSVETVKQTPEQRLSVYSVQTKVVQ